MTGDNVALAERAITEIQSGAAREFCILDAILVELCFVLEFHDYAMARRDIADALQTLLATPQIFVADTTRQALKLYKQHPKLDYADCLLYAFGGKTGVLTFDNDLHKTLLM